MNKEDLVYKTREELVDIILALDERLRENKDLVDCIAKGIKQGFDSNVAYVTLDKTAPFAIRKEDFEYTTCNLICDKIDDFRQLGKEAQELNVVINNTIKDEFVDYKFISGSDDRFPIGKLHLLEPFTVTREEIDKTKETLSKLELIKQGYKHGKEVFGLEGRAIGYSAAIADATHCISNMKLKQKLKDSIITNLKSL